MKSPLTQAQEAAATLQNQLAVNEHNHAQAEDRLSKAENKVSEQDQQTRNILAELTKRKASDDIVTRSAKRRGQHTAWHLLSLRTRNVIIRSSGMIRVASAMDNLLSGSKSGTLRMLN